MKHDNFIGRVFGRLTVLRKTKRRRNGRIMWLCQCRCGKQKAVAGNNLCRTQSCGCLRRDMATAPGNSWSPERNAWRGARERCSNPNNPRYHHYGGRGITVCPRWMDSEKGFVRFFADMGLRPSPRHSLDRIDNDGNYEPRNCRWATAGQQQRNRRRIGSLTHFSIKELQAELSRRQRSV